MCRKFMIRGIYGDKQQLVENALRTNLGKVIHNLPIHFIPSGQNGRNKDDPFVWIEEIPKGTTALQISDLVKQSFATAGISHLGIDIE